MFGGKKYRWSDYRLDSAGPSGQTALWIQRGKARLPGAVDLRSGFGPVHDQGWLQDASVAFAVTSVAEFVFRQQPHFGAWSPLSVLYQHQQTRAYTQKLGGDPASPTIATGVGALLAFGGMRESDWPSMPDRITTQPAFATPREAIPLALVDLNDVWAGPDGVYRTIAEGRPVIFSYVGPADDMKEAGLKGVMPKWKGKTRTSDPAGHALVLTGYDMADETLIVRNSFGADWGDGGYFRMPLSTFFAHAAGVMALGPIEAGRDTKLMGEIYPGADEREAGHRKVLDWIMGESYPGEKDQDASHRKFINALLGEIYPGADERDAGHRKVLDWIMGSAAGSLDQDRMHRTFIDALMRSDSDVDGEGQCCWEQCARMAAAAGLPPLQRAAQHERGRGAVDDRGGGREDHGAASRLGRMARDIREEMSDTTDDAARDFRSRLRRQEDDVMRTPRRGGRDDRGGGDAV